MSWIHNPFLNKILKGLNVASLESLMYIDYLPTLSDVGWDSGKLASVVRAKLRLGMSLIRHLNLPTRRLQANSLAYRGLRYAANQLWYIRMPVVSRTEPPGSCCNSP